ncbi:MAG TPA: adenosylmethionine--8-amino-7-oxononanoate transaminase [Chthoniobacterales bacterium]|jgi:adenosylmethionine-8-amino-7-oxononanoate aminotransferase|nr:adenosylmethionine--8-amino-7-oxononanoate transaminase [Chthoniobacterales bacterium]
MSSLIQLDKTHVWHPFTQMRDWVAPDHQPLMLVAGRGAWLEDSLGRRYLDGNSSIWTNIHGHGHPTLNQAIREQLNQVAHTSFLGFTNPKAVELAVSLVGLLPGSSLTKVFFSDDGSTAVEVAIKMAVQYFLQTSHPKKAGFVSFENAYHGDTFGASSLGGISLFRGQFKSHPFPVTRIGSVDSLAAIDGSGIAGLIIEPMIQGAAGMRLWPPGILKTLRQWCDDNDTLLIFDEVMTGFGRTGKYFACQHDEIYPDFLAIAKGLTGGYLPLAATLTTDRIFSGFLGSYEETFFYGHSYCGNPLGCAVALANLAVFEEGRVLEKLQPKIGHLARRLQGLEDLPNVRETRRAGFIAGIEVARRDGGSFDVRDQVGAQVCLAARPYGLLTRPIRDVIVLMLPLCATCEEVDLAIDAIEKAITEICDRAG